MGLTNNAMGIQAIDSGLVIKKQSPTDRVVALAGNPNVGKSTVFNSLTGLHQHTGNWPGKTVTNAQGYCTGKRQSYVMVDIPGTYSLMAHSAEEEVARNFICFGEPDAVVVVCDATCLERNLNLVLQTLEISRHVIVCVNLMDEAKRKHIKIDLAGISARLGVPVVGAVARNKKTLAPLLHAMDSVTGGEKCAPLTPPVQYPDAVETAISVLQPVLSSMLQERINSRWLSLKLLDDDPTLQQEITAYLGDAFLKTNALTAALAQARAVLSDAGITQDTLKDMVVSALVHQAEDICRGTVLFEKSTYGLADRKIDKILTSKWTGYPIMLLLLALIFWITITGANYPSALLADGLFWLQDRLTEFFLAIHAPDWLHGVLVLGVYRVLAWVISVMLPPMAIFFPLFTLLEDLGYLPRVAYNLDKPFQRCRACGKQALSMWVVDKGMRMG